MQDWHLQLWQTARHKSAYTIDTSIVYEAPLKQSTVLIMINQAFKIDSMTNIIVCPMQYCIHSMVVNECPKFLSPRPSEEDHVFLCITLWAVAHQSEYHCHLKASPANLMSGVQAWQSMRMIGFQVPPHIKKITLKPLNLQVGLTRGWHCWS